MRKFLKNKIFFRSPSNFPLDFDDFPDIFNLTMTFRLDSDILYGYGQVVDVESRNKIAPALDIKWREPEENFTSMQITSKFLKNAENFINFEFLDQKYLEIVKVKTKAATWFVSQCNRTSRRDKLAAELGKFIDIDIFGDCGNLFNLFLSLRF